MVKATLLILGYILSVTVVVLLAESKPYQSECGEDFGFFAWNYGDIAYDKCKAHPVISASRDYRGACDNLQEAFEEFVEEKGHDLLPYFQDGESITELEDRAMSGYFRMKADYLIDEAVEWLAKNPKNAKNAARIRAYVNSKFFGWFTKLLKNEQPPPISDEVKKLFAPGQLEKLL